MLFNFRGTDPEAVRLYHCIHARKEIQVSFLVAAHEISGKNDCLARKALNLPKSFRCRFGRVPISLGHATTAVDELTGDAWRAILSLLVQDVEINFRDRFADRSRSGRELIGR